MSLRLSDKCRRSALQDPCKTTAAMVAESKCAGTSGRGRAACMEGHFEAALIEHCRDVVCPGDPTAVYDPHPSVVSPGITYGQEEGGHYTGDSGFEVRTGNESVEKPADLTAGETDVDKLKIYLGVGIAALAVIYFIRKK